MYDSLQRLAALPREHGALLRPRIYARQRPLRGPRRARQRRDRRTADEVEALRDAGEITLPTSVAQERETNPFVRATNVEEFARLRADKDSFRS